ncbi:ribonuclease E inhibitor RraB [Bacillus mycoides]|uniref:ribonuclease E inhibitor RraB n=1 Tax=Bacillus mycoides TaxID=1405 RepID=UPI00273AAF7C|nr:ribonuclease E inhibitor RraB [Bacillus mycoides]WOA60632.1 ribonuclease E inhibitor RraB [Bacillus mycoides]
MLETVHERQEREKQDIETLIALKKAGSNLSKVHYLEHYFLVDTIEIAEKIADVLHVKGYDIYKPSEQISEDGLSYYVFIVGKNCIPTKENVWKETKHMAELAVLYSGTCNSYDGWETQIVE